jgi:hypothetical protein
VFEAEMQLIGTSRDAAARACVRRAPETSNATTGTTARARSAVAPETFVPWS